ncbi:hypothetical protein [Pseudonocardia kunmingensis]|uniref:hypothetical protein n=1 Tax=Pseudonocardia kunmingensis TaxID=630975 RepID=UPI00114E3F4A|nr:hypothetical protein [Pseudonocardia kunmingensis]
MPQPQSADLPRRVSQHGNDIESLYELVQGVDEKVEAVDQKVEALTIEFRSFRESTDATLQEILRAVRGR